MIESPRNARVRSVAALRRRDVRAETGMFLLEGPQAVTEALQWRPELLEQLFITPTALERHPQIGDAASDARLVVQFATEQVIDAMADTVTPQGVVAVCRQFPVSLRRMLAGLDGQPPRLLAVLEEVRDPGNLGTIIRAADAAGADGVVLTGRTVDLYNPKVVRSTTGSLFHVPVAIADEFVAVRERLAEAGLQVLAADVKGEDLPALVAGGLLAQPTAWVFGNEARGLPDELVTLADRVAKVPIYGRAESLNLATAASVCLYASAFAQRE